MPDLLDFRQQHLVHHFKVLATDHDADAVDLVVDGWVRVVARSALHRLGSQLGDYYTSSLTLLGCKPHLRVVPDVAVHDGGKVRAVEAINPHRVAEPELDLPALLPVSVNKILLVLQIYFLEKAEKYLFFLVSFVCIG